MDNLLTPFEELTQEEQDRRFEFMMDSVGEELSQCCGVEIVNGFCSDCKEHC